MMWDMSVELRNAALDSDSWEPSFTRPGVDALPRFSLAADILLKKCVL